MSLSRPLPEWASPWTSLLEAAVQPQTGRQYRLGVQHFLIWIRNEFRYPLRTAREIDRALAEYGQWVYEHHGGRGKWRLRMAVFGVEHFLPSLQKKMVLGRRSIEGWNNLRPPTPHPPITYALACLVAAELSRMGHPGAAVAVLLAYDCYLRISELGDLRVCDISEVSEIMLDDSGLRPLSFTGTLVSLQHCKTGNNQSVRVRRPQVGALLTSWVDYVRERTGSARARLFPGPEEFRGLFYTAQINLGWDVEGGNAFVPHSLRHGGASGDFLIWGGRRLEEILFRGRWASVTSTRHYIQIGPALMATSMRRIPVWQRDLGSFIAQVLRAYIDIPNDY